MPYNPVYAVTDTRPDSPDQLLYAGMAYGTPHHSHLLGQQASGVNFNAQPNALAPVARPGNWFAATYTDLFRRALSDPLLAYGLDMSRIGLVPEQSWRRNDMAFYNPMSDSGGASVPPNGNTDSLVHEHMHRSINAMTRDALAAPMLANSYPAGAPNGMLAHLSTGQNPFHVVGQRHHEIIGQALPNTEDYADDPAAQARYRALQGIANTRNQQMRSPMGPR
jgi:hypothetical protein